MFYVACEVELLAFVLLMMHNCPFGYRRVNYDRMLQMRIRGKKIVHK